MYEFEADPRHAESVVQQTLGNQGRAAVIPGLDEKEKEEEEEDKPLEGDSVKLFRSIAARCNYLSQDRPELMLPVKGRVQGDGFADCWVLETIGQDWSVSQRSPSTSLVLWLAGSP